MRVLHFSLIELMVVMAIILLIAGVAVGRLGKMPSFASQEKVILEVGRFFAQASRVAAVRGRQLNVKYTPSDHCFQLEDDLKIYQVPADFAPKTEDALEFFCRPDGTVSGPPLRFEGKILRFSPLTGILHEVSP